MIKGFVGTYGSGKTLWLASQAQWYFKRDLPVWSNMPIWGYNSKGQKQSAKFIHTDDIFGILNGTLFQDKQTLLIIDEASNLFDSYKFRDIPTEIFDILKQSRKIKLDIFYTSQRHQDIATRIRDNSEIIYLCSQHLKRTPLRLYSAMGVQPFYFNDNAKSVDIKQYIKVRRLSFAFMMRKNFKYYMTEFIVTSKSAYQRFADYLGDPTKLSPDDIILSSKKFVEVSPPL